jgi:hypothetical protein
MLQQDSAPPAAGQPADEPELIPIRVFQRADGSYAIFSRSPDGILHLHRLIALPDERSAPSPQQLRSIRFVLFMLEQAVRLVMMGLVEDRGLLAALDEFADALSAHVDELLP